MALTVTFNGINITTADSTSGWGNTTVTSAEAWTVEVVHQGAAAIGFQASNKDGMGYFTYGTPLNFNTTYLGQHVFFWVNVTMPGTVEALSTGGLYLIVGSSSTDYKKFLIAAKDYKEVMEKGFARFVLDPSKTATETVGSGEITETIAGYTKDASVLKEAQVHKTLRNRDTQHAKMYAQSGFKMKFKMQEVAPGVKALLPSEISYREEPDFAQALPVKPSEHPVWATTSSLFGTVAKYGLIGYGLSELSGVLAAGYDAAGHSFNGNTNIENSLNNAGRDQRFMGAEQYQGSVITQAEQEPYVEDGKCWASPGCSCESFMEGKCT